MIVMICTNCGQSTSLLEIEGDLWRCSFCKMRQLRSAKCVAESDSLYASPLWLRLHAKERSRARLAELAGTEGSKVKFFLEHFGISCKDFEVSELESRKKIKDLLTELNSGSKFVYLVQASNGYIKVGKSADPRKRLGGLRSGSPLPLNLLHVIKCQDWPYDAATIEEAIHVLLTPYHLHGEWFNIPQDLLSRICKLQDSNLHHLLNLVVK